MLFNILCNIIMHIILQYYNFLSFHFSFLLNPFSFYVSLSYLSLFIFPSIFPYPFPSLSSFSIFFYSSLIFFNIFTVNCLWISIVISFMIDANSGIKHTIFPITFIFALLPKTNRSNLSL